MSRYQKCSCLRFLCQPNTSCYLLPCTKKYQSLFCSINHSSTAAPTSTVWQEVEVFLTFKRSWYTFLSAGNVETCRSDGIIGSPLQALLFIHLLEQVVCSVLQSKKHIYSKQKTWIHLVKVFTTFLMGLNSVYLHKPKISVFVRANYENLRKRVLYFLFS